MAISKNDFTKYTILPGIVPRVSSLLGSGFAFLASLIAVIYYNVGLLPAGHVYLRQDNFGRFGLRHVIAEAGNNLTFERKHLDKIVIYFTILIGLALIAVQIVLLCTSLLASPVFAGPWSSIFLTTPAGHTSSQDMAFIVLDNVFGMKVGSGTGIATGFYNSCISDLGTACLDIQGNIIPSPTSYPLPMHLALHSMLHFYTMGIAMISGVILIYFVITIVGETVTTGIPFGQRLNRAWFIPRLIVFFALLAPVSTANNNAGINVAQLIVFSVAKFGSNMATNVWLQFNDTAIGTTSQFLGQSQSLLAEPTLPEIGGLTQFMHVVRLCIVAEKIVNGLDVYPYFVRPHSDDTTSVLLHDGTTEGGGAANMGGTTNDYLPLDVVSSFDEAVVFSRYKTVVLRVGHRNPPGFLPNPSGYPGAPADGSLAPNNKTGSYSEEWGHVQPTCGELHFDITSVDEFVINFGGIQDEYFLEVLEYFTLNDMADNTVLCMAQAILPYGHNPGCVDNPYATSWGQFDITSDTQWITAAGARANIEFFNSSSSLFLNGQFYDWGSVTASGTPIFDDIRTAYDTAAYSGNLLMPVRVRERGWAGAALWYNKIAELNGLVVSAIKNVPRPFRYPMVMEIISEAHKLNDSNVSYGDRFNPRLQNGQLVSLPRPGDQYIAAALYSDYNFWRTSKVHETVHTRSSKNVIIDFINTVFGTDGLLNIMDNQGTHPLAMLSSAGKSLVDASIRNLFIGVVGQGAAGMLTDDFFGPIASTAGEFLVSMSLLTLSIGFMLYYVLPFMPFIYFFFAFAGWIKSIFEAVVAMPLWAVAHIKIDGEGLPGPWATNGYFLIFEIFLRPTLIVVGLLASISIFSALVAMLHEVFHVLTLSATGFDMKKEIFDTTILSTGDSLDYWRSPVDEMFYTVIYVIIVYMIGLSSFKLIDQIPNNIMRWMGVTVSTFHETAGDPAGELSGKMYRATQMTNAQITTSIARMKGTATAQSERSVAETELILSDVRLKENIILIGEELGHNIYEFDYLDGSGRFRGVMAQEVMESRPDAVTRHSNGYLAVNYDKLGLRMVRV
ncbi:MAG: hypothetical protein COA45_09100 [Zetaproteobacteria bacterium]|nr:MAG: hypothetical protein COA45_09100 [Zetaproteobacteria bacterium]